MTYVHLCVSRRTSKICVLSTLALETKRKEDRDRKREKPALALYKRSRSREACCFPKAVSSTLHLPSARNGNPLSRHPMTEPKCTSQEYRSTLGHRRTSHQISANPEQGRPPTKDNVKGWGKQRGGNKKKRFWESKDQPLHLLHTPLKSLSWK